MMDIEATQLRLREFVNKRNWDQFHTPKNLSMALAGEAAELMEIFQWLTPEEAWQILESPKDMDLVAQELADIFMYVLRLTDVMRVDIADAVDKKLKENIVKYPEGFETPRSKKFPWRV